MVNKKQCQKGMNTCSDFSKITKLSEYIFEWKCSVCGKIEVREFNSKDTSWKVINDY